MPGRIEDYALLGDCQTAALVGRDGSIDWYCTPKFDSPACFAALLGGPENGRWLLAPRGPIRRVSRRYREGTLILETEFETDEGTVALIDFMPPRSKSPDLVRIVEGRRGRVPMTMELIIRFDYGSVVPWVRRADRGVRAIAGPDMLELRTDVETHGEDFKTLAEFDAVEGGRTSFDLTWHPSHEPGCEELDVSAALTETEAWWREWSGRCTVEGEWCEAVRRSLITLKALTYAPTGGIVAAPTTSLPELAGGVRNWDYRYCWLRDATFTLYALMLAGYREEAAAWREWLLRAVAGAPSKLQIMYGLSGERRLTEMEIPWLPGYEGSAPVRVGNGAWRQHQLDVYGEVMDSLHQARRLGLEGDGDSWRLQRALMDFLESDWREPDEGIWEVRGPRRQFTHSKVMAWVAFDRAVKAVEQSGLDGPVGRWKALRAEVHAQVCRDGFDAGLNSFVQSYGGRELDASLLMMPLVGFLPATDPRVRGTVEAIERNLMTDGFVNRYTFAPDVDGLPPGEGAFLLCTFWLADVLALMGRRDDAQRIFDKLLSIRNDVGLLSEAYDPAAGRLLGNFPQAFSHIGLVNTAYNLAPSPGCAADDRPNG
ncbi:glycoside hydrolase family 15 protein [Paludisphaera soli]|uniref:glycoside hydrolase family 15 protein n=1 Tax=Paludisphaera soli TaxID=2712865 RepID=UPI0013ED1524|nr:glycoside hydrolase family 15 protein [Paludisphaera soli]